MDGGIGEAALLEAILGGAQTGAAIGGGSALLTGGDPLQGALRGGLMGGATGGIFNGAMPGAEAVTPTTSAGAMTPSSFASAPMDMTAYAPTPTQFGAFGEAPSAVGSSFDSSIYSGATPSGTLSVSDAAQQAASQDFGTSQIAANTPRVGSANMFGKAGQWWDTLTPKQQLMTGGAGVLGLGMIADRNKYGVPKQTPYTGPLSQFHFNPATYQPTYAYAEGGITTLDSGGYDRMVGEEPMYSSNMNSGGIASLGGYSDGGRMLKGPGDGMSDSIPATIAGKRPARLATDEFVVPADVVSHLGNGSSDAGAKQLYAMMDKVRQARTGHKKQGREINPNKYMPA
jgi:hypothetical protein